MGAELALTNEELDFSNSEIEVSGILGMPSTPSSIEGLRDSFGQSQVIVGLEAPTSVDDGIERLWRNLQFPDRQTIVKTEYEQLRGICESNHCEIVAYLSDHMDAIPFVGVLGLCHSDFQQFERCRGERDEITFVAVFKQKADHPAAFYEDLCYMISLGEAFADPHTHGVRGIDYQPGGMIFVDMSSQVSESVRFDADHDTFPTALPLQIPGAVVDRTPRPRPLGPLHSDRQFAGVITTTLDSGSYDERVLGVVPWIVAGDYSADLVPSTKSHTIAEDIAAKNSLCDLFREQMFVYHLLSSF